MRFSYGMLDITPPNPQYLCCTHVGRHTRYAPQRVQQSVASCAPDGLVTQVFTLSVTVTASTCGQPPPWSQPLCLSRPPPSTPPPTTHTHPPTQLTWLLDDAGVPAHWRALEGHSVNTYTLINAQGQERYVKFIWTPSYPGVSMQQPPTWRGPLLGGPGPPHKRMYYCMHVCTNTATSLRLLF
jgi:hypothetical protein